MYREVKKMFQFHRPTCNKFSANKAFIILHDILFFLASLVWTASPSSFIHLDDGQLLLIEIYAVHLGNIGPSQISDVFQWPKPLQHYLSRICNGLTFSSRIVQFRYVFDLRASCECMFARTCIFQDKMQDNACFVMK